MTSSEARPELTCSADRLETSATISSGTSAELVWRLILKDCRLQRGQFVFTIAGGAISLAVLSIVQLRSEAPVVVGTVCFFIAIILSAHMVPLVGIVNERKSRNLAFVMSLPISSIQYTAAKLISTLVMFLVPWLMLVASALLLIEVRGIIPRGSIPVALILVLLPLVGLSLITAAALIGESEGWGIAANVFCSSTYGLTWYFLSQVPALMGPAKGPVPVWNGTALSILGGELAFVVLLLGLTFYLQSRKRDFV